MSDWQEIIDELRKNLQSANCREIPTDDPDHRTLRYDFEPGIPGSIVIRHRSGTPLKIVNLDVEFANLIVIVDEA